MTLVETNFPARDRLNDRMVREAVVSGPASYTTGGDPVNGPSILGMAEVYGVYGQLTNGTAVVVAAFSYAAQTVLFFVPNTGAQVANAFDLSGYSGTLLFTGKG